MSQINLVEITTEYIELNKFLKFENLVESGGHAKLVIADGQVRVNGKVAMQTRKKVRDGDVVTLAGEQYKIVVVQE
ncbi:RNA-binding S4 domain-containing protein [Psychrosphaera sp. F3M07]|jgi:ribosome-associated protein|uniref:RNA-binding S4 domain-containing protein n=1 Tax=Psychrosphaera aquimarina TaxID=2044854 RepID=A0ABU3QVU5_9GAMM|nr:MULTISPECIES: RNA-binding S4 domain-containing protein [Psychrosphaera]MBU2918569.1 RNA-binding S4 domain-containing protein [Psychrosphaera sp. F3M07]MDU0111556.1 RNA-binding S4 domain-containing protein [Psychrosphaera aquimarina]